MASSDEANIDLPARRLWLIIGSVVGLIVLAFLIVPVWKGFWMYQDAKDSGVPEEYLGNLQELQVAKETAERLAREADDRARIAEDKSDIYRATSLEAMQNLSVGQEDLVKKEKMYKDLASSYSEELSQTEGDLEACLEMQDGVIQDAARRICCIKRIDNPAISGYEIDDGKIVCVESGGEPVSC